MLDLNVSDPCIDGVAAIIKAMAKKSNAGITCTFSKNPINGLFRFGVWLGDLKGLVFGEDGNPSATDVSGAVKLVEVTGKDVGQMDDVCVAFVTGPRYTVLGNSDGSKTLVWH